MRNVITSALLLLALLLPASAAAYNFEEGGIYSLENIISDLLHVRR